LNRDDINNTQLAQPFASVTLTLDETLRKLTRQRPALQRRGVSLVSVADSVDKRG
jgi:hypothetical protein